MYTEDSPHFGEYNGVQLVWFESHPELRSEGTILLVHATGFHARCWDAVVRDLGSRHVIALDMRGHGRSDNTGPFSWDIFGADVAAFLAVLDLDHVTAVGHSFGGHAVTWAAHEHPQRIDRLLLVDPVILDPSGYESTLHERWLTEDGEHPIALRRNAFASADEMFQSYRDKASFGIWRESVLRSYCEHGLVPADSGDGFQLACPPAIEAAIYMGTSGTNIHHVLGDVKQPVTVLRAQQRPDDAQSIDFSKSPTWPGLAAALPNAVDIYLPHLSHFIPMQEPELVAKHILACDRQA
jgi:pimeloyl-ACP methyl ester carboxylesterase